MDKFHPHDLTWTRELSSRFWEDYSERVRDEAYFSNQRGDALLRFARKRIKSMSKLRLLDFGCGPGFLIAKMLAKNIHCAGCDFSKVSIERTRNLAGRNSKFLGATLVSELPTDLASESFDVIFFVETIEHLLDEDLEATLRELARLLAPNGYLVVTTPNAEDLETGNVFCPESGALFHRMQHVRSWSVDSLQPFLATFGFAEIYCKPTFLAEPT